MKSPRVVNRNTAATVSISASVTRKQSNNILFYQLLAFFLTALVYSLSHASRTVWGYAKPYLADSNTYFTSGKLGVLDFTFMTSYAIGQYLSGWLGDRVNLKVFLFTGLSLSAGALSLFGCLEGFVLLDSLAIAMIIFILNGLGQSTAYSGCISIVSNWFRNGKTGLVFGLWGTCLNIGDIIGQQIGAIAINEEGLSWQYALFIASGALLFFLINLVIFVKIHPDDLKKQEESRPSMLTEALDPEIQSAETNHHGHGHGGHGKAIRFIDAWRIKNVPYFALGFFCVKGVIYGTMFWLPFYLSKQVGLEGNISLLLASIEIGMLIGSVLLGFLSDRIQSRSIIISFGFFFSVIFLIFTYLIRSIKIKSFYFVLLLLAGMGIGGPASLIGGAVSSDIGQQLAQKSAVSAIATIAGIMEGCGALGAAVTQLFVSNFTGITFPFFAALCLIGGLLMLPIAKADYKRIKSQRRLIADAAEGEEFRQQTY